ncbi:unnamed protein product [Urochloa humidicola]
MAPVRIVDVSYVTAPASAAGAPPPESIKLNAMEAQWVVAPVLQHLLLFDEGDHQLPPFDAVVQSLKSSLAATLSTHAPLAGKLHYLADTGDVAILFSATGGGGGDAEGVRFVVAETDADARSLAGDEDHDVLTFEGLVPEADMTVLPAPLLAVQATRLGGGGVALGDRCGDSWRRGPRLAVGTRCPSRLRASTAPVSACPAARNSPGAS